MRPHQKINDALKRRKNVQFFVKIIKVLADFFGKSLISDISRPARPKIPVIPVNFPTRIKRNWKIDYLSNLEMYVGRGYWLLREPCGRNFRFKKFVDFFTVGKTANKKIFWARPFQSIFQFSIPPHMNLNKNCHAWACPCRKSVILLRKLDL